VEVDADADVDADVDVDVDGNLRRRGRGRSSTWQKTARTSFPSLTYPSLKFPSLLTYPSRCAARLLPRSYGKNSPPLKIVGLTMCRHIGSE